MKIRICAALLCAVLAVSLLAGCELSVAPTEPTQPREIFQVDITGDAPVVADVQIGTESAHFTSPAQPTQLTQEAAVAAALAHASLTAQQITGLQAELDTDDGPAEYDIEFYFDGWEYDYEIHAETGEVLKSEKEPERD